MSDVQVRLFRRGDRDQLTHLVNAHAEAVVPGMSVSVNTVLGSLERQPGEFIEDPWVSERVTLVAEQHSRIAAAAHLLRYFPDDRAGPAYRDAGEIRWLLYWPLAPAGNPCWPDATAAAEALMAACIEVCDRWGVTRQYAGGELPVPGVYGVPEQWPHIAALYRRAGFCHTGHIEVVYLAPVEDLPGPGVPPLDGLAVSRSVGINGCRLSAVLGEEVIGYIETEILDEGERMSRHGGWADVGNLRVAAPYRRRGVGSRLLGEAAGWLRLAQVTRLLDYAWLEGTDPAGQSYDDYRAFLPAVGFRELTRTARGWTRERLTAGHVAVPEYCALLRVGGGSIGRHDKDRYSREVIGMAGMLQMRRSRGAFSGFLLMLLGLWGALIPFVGPYFHYAYTPDKAWTYNTGRLWLELLPGAAVFVGGFLLMIAKSRHTALFGALLAAAAGAWFTLGPVLSPLWNNHIPMGGSPASATVYMRIMEQLGFFTALGVVIVFVAAMALGRIASVASGIRDIEEIPETTVPETTVPESRVPADTVPVERVPAHTGALPTRTRMEPVVPAKPARSESEETRPVPAQDTTGTIGSGTIQ